MNDQGDFAAFILSNGRPDRVVTYKSLRRSGYTGKIFIVIDDLDKTRDQYLAEFGDEVIIFNKAEVAKTFDQGDNFNDMRAIIYARNACFEIAKTLGIRTFVQLDDDYTNFSFRFNKKLDYVPATVTDLDAVFRCIVKFFYSTNMYSIAIAQGGDFLGGSESPIAQSVQLRRKCMNSFFCSVDRPFQFVGRINEDVNTYTYRANQGLLLFTINQLTLIQRQTQTNSGGMTELYLDSGTYVKSFYSVMYHPSGVKIGVMQSKNKRLHHQVKWKNTTPMILRESWKKSV